MKMEIGHTHTQKKVAYSVVELKYVEKNSKVTLVMH